jgi:multimeric flavodoxin WrbA
MKFIGINGSPRRNCNTAEMLEQALKGAAAAGAETERVDLYGLDFKGCLSCYACKRLDGKRVCAVKDGLAPVLEKLRNADAVIFASPIYFVRITSGLHACLERFFFPFFTFSSDKRTFCERRLPIGYIYTAGGNKELLDQYRLNLNSFENFTEMAFNEKPRVLFSYNTSHFSDYSKYLHSAYDVEDKARQKAEQFPRDCAAAREFGAALAARAKELAAG